MAHAILIAHLPLLRLERREDVRFGEGLLTRLPWEQFESLTQGAFSDWKPKYERTDPVFFWHELDGDLPFVQPGAASGMQEMKVPQESWADLLPRLGLGILSAFHEHLVDPVWAALALAAPAGILPPPRSSVTFLLPAGGDACLEFGGQKTSGVRLQGDADIELAHLPDGAGLPLPDRTLAAAAALVPLARYALAHAEIAPALRQLLVSGDVTLAPLESLLLAVTAIEHLLLPDATVGSGEVFARRLAHLLAHDESGRAHLHQAARQLYRHRTAVLHAEPIDGHGAPGPAAAQQLLAAALVSVTASVGSGTTLDAFRATLDQAATEPALPGEPLPDVAAGRAGRSRLGPIAPWSSATFSSSEDLSSPAGTIFSWSPLIGLRHEGDDIVHEGLGVVLTRMSADAVVGMEEKDIRRDFIANVRLGDFVAALAVGRQHDSLIVNEADVAPLVRRRDLAVAGLRLAGFDALVDPELLGWYVYAGRLRYRRETVLRQSVIQRIDTAVPGTLDSASIERLQEAWSLLARYESDARHDEVDRLLHLFRRIHDRRFLPSATRAVLAASLVEAMLGRFRPPTATLRLERLVRALHGVPDDSARWFETDGRAFRNQLAHGQWHPERSDGTEIWTRNPAPVAHLVAIARAALTRLLEVWAAADPPVRARYGPARVLVRQLAKDVA